MHDIIAFLKGAVSRSPNPGIMGCYIANGDALFAYNEKIQAGVSLETGAKFNVPAIELEAALARMPEVKSLAFDGEALQINGGRVRATIQCVIDDPPNFPPLPDKWIPCPERFAGALKLALPFTGEQGWTAGIQISNGVITAIKNTGGIRIIMPSLEMAEPALITKDCAEFIAAQGSPSDYANQQSALFFRWADGRWLRAQLLNAKMPESVESIFDKAGVNAPCEITDEWRAAYEDVAALSEGRVQFDNQGWRSAKGAGRAFIEIETLGLLENHESKWQTDVLGPVIACASAWNPSAYPNPALFIGESFKGVVVGIR